MDKKSRPSLSLSLPRRHNPERLRGAVRSVSFFCKCPSVCSALTLSSLIKYPVEF